MAEEDKEKVFTLSPEIEKYIELLSKDPKSRVFAPLAEAYRKGGLLDEAIQVARDGLKFNPNYVSGRMALGRAYYDKGMKTEAREELEKAVKAAPDNIMAHKILGEIYQAEGGNEEAIRSFKIVLALNPGDKEVSEALDVLEGRKPPPSVPAEPVKAPTVEKEEVKAEPEKVVPEVAEAPPPKAEVSPLPAPAGQAGPEKVEEVEAPPSVEKEEVVGKEEVPSSVAEEAGQEGTESFEGLDETFKEFEETPPEAAEKEVEMRDEAESAPARLRQETLRAEPEDEIPREESSEQAQVPSPEPGVKVESEAESPPGEPEITETETHQVQPEAGREELATVTMAELYIKQGYPEKAQDVYQNILASDPNNLEIKKKVEELSEQLKSSPSPENQLEKRVEGNIQSLSTWLDKIKKGG